MNELSFKTDEEATSALADYLKTKDLSGQIRVLKTLNSMDFLAYNNNGKLNRIPESSPLWLFEKFDVTVYRLR